MGLDGVSVGGRVEGGVVEDDGPESDPEDDGPGGEATEDDGSGWSGGSSPKGS